MNGDAECATGVGHTPKQSFTHTHAHAHALTNAHALKDRHPPTRAKEEHKRFMLKIWRRGETHTHTG